MSCTPVAPVEVQLMVASLPAKYVTLVPDGHAGLRVSVSVMVAPVTPPLTVPVSPPPVAAPVGARVAGAPVRTALGIALAEGVALAVAEGDAVFWIATAPLEPQAVRPRAAAAAAPAKRIGRQRWEAMRSHCASLNDSRQ